MIRELFPVRENSSERSRWAACQCVHVGDVDRPERTPVATASEDGVDG